MNLDRFITETVHKQLLVENAINNSWRQARKMVIDRFKCSKEDAEKRVDEISILVGISYEMVKFIKGCTRMVLNGELNDQRVLGDFKDALNKIKTDGHIKEFDSDLRRLDQPADAVNSAKDIIAIFKPEIDRERAEQRQKLSGMEFVPNPDYEIVKINSFKEARKYSRYTSWCVTSRRVNYDSYTGNGINQFYFCLQNGFENIEDDGDFNDKKDAYALSMLAILVNPEGELIHCTNRKNNDQDVLNPIEISNLIGCNFYEAFKPNTTWRDALEDVKNMLSNGESPYNVFDEVITINNGLFLVRLLGRWSVLNGSSFINEHWYDIVSDFFEGFARVCDEGKGWNFINRDGKEICDRWYDGACDFREGFAQVVDKNKGWAFINRDGKEVFGQWYVSVGYFSEGFAAVKYEDKGYNFINHDGEELCDRWYDMVWNFQEGFAAVKDVNKGWNFINRDGKEISDRWYVDTYKFSEGFAVVKDNNECYNFINREGKEISDRWYDFAFGFSEGFAEVKYKGEYYWLRKDGVLCDYETREPIEDSPTQMAESIINRLVRDVLSENRKRHYL